MVRSSRLLVLASSGDISLLLAHSRETKYILYYYAVVSSEKSVRCSLLSREERAPTRELTICMCRSTRK